jgi:hypothetical protein
MTSRQLYQPPSARQGIHHPAVVIGWLWHSPTTACRSAARRREVSVYGQFSRGCSHANFRLGKGRGDKATQYRPVALEVAVTIIETAHHHLREVGYPQVDVGAGQAGGQFIVSDGGIEIWIPQFGSEHIRRSRSDQSPAQARAIGLDDVPRQVVAAGVLGDVEDTLDDLIRKAGLPGD